MKKLLRTTRLPVHLPWLVMCIGWLASGCASSRQYTFSPLPGDLFKSESIGAAIERAMVGDVVIIKFHEGMPLEERIKEDGTITLPLIGVIKANDKTAHELETEIKNRYVPDYYKRLGVSVAIGRGVYYVGGQVQRPGSCHYPGPITVTKAIEGAGGFTKYASRKRVELTRGNGKKFRVDCRKAAQDPSLDLPIYPGDKIDVPLGPGEINFQPEF